MRTSLSMPVRYLAVLIVTILLSVTAVSWGRNTRALAPAAAMQAATGETCINCHRMETGFSHPVGVIPSMPIPRHLPLVNGRIGCATCHEGGSGADHTRSQLQKTSLLRDDGLGNLCAQCHLGGGSRSWHTTQGKAHLRWEGRNSRSTGELLGGLDRESRDCLSCHDGTIARDVTASPTGDLPDHAKGHPIGSVYKAAAPNRRTGENGYTFSLDPRVRLFEGTVGCGSCHSPYSREENSLVMPNHGSRLCLTCHQM